MPNVLQMRATNSTAVWRGCAVLCVAALIVLATGATQTILHSSHAQSVKIAHQNSRACLENLDLQCANVAANIQVFDTVEHSSPVLTVNHLINEAADGRRHNRPPPTA